MTQQEYCSTQQYSLGGNIIAGMFQECLNINV